MHSSFNRFWKPLKYDIIPGGVYDSPHLHLSHELRTICTYIDIYSLGYNFLDIGKYQSIEEIFNVGGKMAVKAPREIQFDSLYSIFVKGLVYLLSVSLDRNFSVWHSSLENNKIKMPLKKFWELTITCFFSTKKNITFKTCLYYLNALYFPLLLSSGNIDLSVIK